jgi:large subunit ribosomal protein L6
MKNISKKLIIKIPENIKVSYSTEKKIIVVEGPLEKKSLKLKLSICLLAKERLIVITSNTFSKTSSNERKKIKALQGTEVALIKQLMIETSSVFYQKIKLIGVGYRAFEVDNFKQLLLFKLGYSHEIFFKNPVELNTFCLKFTKLFIYGNSYQSIMQTAAIIRSYKSPEPYKGKGILYENQKITLKEGKKV